MGTYSPPAITATGLTIPAYQDIVDDLTAQAKQIYGQDLYLGPDSQDYQYISSFAAKINDTNQLLQAVYNARGPLTATGSSLDGLVKLNGLARKASTYSTCPVTLTGTAGTVISNGLVGGAGYQWAVPSPITIGVGGTISVTATCTTAGAVTANPGDLSQIVTPTYGWTSVTNTAAATPGQAQEADSALRSRQAISTAQPSQTLLEGTIGAIAELAGVTRYAVLENKGGDTSGYETGAASPSTDISAGPANTFQIAVDGDAPSLSYHSVTLTLTGLTTVGAIAAEMQTQIQALGGIYAGVTVTYSSAASAYVITSGTSGYASAVRVTSGATNDVAAALKIGRINGAVDTDGKPAHSITPVVEGGDSTAIATAIWQRKGPGCNTAPGGDQQIPITDANGQVTTIGFYRPAYADFDVVVNVKKLQGYTTSVESAMQTAIADFLTSLGLDTQVCPISSLWGAAMTAQPSLAKPAFSVTSITAARHGEAQGTADLTAAFYEAFRGNTSYITINAT